MTRILSSTCVFIRDIRVIIRKFASPKNKNAKHATPRAADIAGSLRASSRSPQHLTELGTGRKAQSCPYWLSARPPLYQRSVKHALHNSHPAGYSVTLGVFSCYPKFDSKIRNKNRQLKIFIGPISLISPI